MKFVLLLSALLNSLLIFAQTDTIGVSGTVRCGSEPVDAGIVAMLSPTDSSIVAYSVTDEYGRYAMRVATRLDEVLLRLTGFNIKRQVQRVKAQTQTVDFAAEEENIVLHEVIIKAQKLWGSRDTLNYLVSAYTRDHDRTIGDVLRQLPGITIDDDGTIKYQGTPINHFYIENLDMLQGRYGLATKGIKAEEVATVQVLENHEHVRALQDQVPPESAAINLKLKEKAKGVWTKSVDLAAGWMGSDAPLWDATLQGMHFDKNEQHMLRYSGDNMGSGHDVAASHYGESAGSMGCMVGLVGHGSSPVGNSLFGYRHGVNLNNLAKLADDATMKYNLNYSHGYRHGESFARTTYVLPEGTERLLVEEIADRTRTNSADLQLTYEKNADKKFLNNTLTLSGRWNEGRGTVGATGQALHYRSLAASNTTRWVHRTAKGGGFELTSTNNLSTSPQALAIGGDMTARQEIDITTVSTNNRFETLHDLRSHCWTLSVSAHADATYTALQSSLVHPDAPTPGDFSYLRAVAGLGPLARYAKGTFRTTLRLPVSLGYTQVRNADLPDEQTDADRVKLRLQPSLSMLWKATDNFTFEGSTGYSSGETSWSQLLTASLMQNYRSLSRYRASINDSHSASACLKVSFKDIFSGLFAHVEGRCNRSWSDIAYGTTLDDQAHTVVEAAYAPNHSTSRSLSLYGRKDIDWHTAQIELNVSLSRTNSQMLRQSVLTDYTGHGCTLGGTISFDIVSGYRMDYSASWSRSRSSSSVYSTTMRDFSQRGRLTMRLAPSRLFLNLNASHTHNANLPSQRKDYVFVGAGLKWKAAKQVELNFDGDNLTNISTYRILNIGDMETHYAEYSLRPMSVVLSAHISL